MLPRKGFHFQFRSRGDAAFTRVPSESEDFQSHTLSTFHTVPRSVNAFNLRGGCCPFPTFLYVALSRFWDSNLENGSTALQGDNGGRRLRLVEISFRFVRLQLTLTF